MKYVWIDEFLLSKKFVSKDLKREWNWVRYLIGGKMFAAVCLDQNDKPYYITLKLEPMEGEMLRKQYKDIILDNKYHFKTITALAKFLNVSWTQADRYIKGECKSNHTFKLIV